MDKRKQTAARGRVGASSKRKNSRAAKGGAERRRLTWSEWALMGIVLVAAVVIGLALSLQLMDSPAERAQKRLAAIADDYYVEYVYPRLTEAGTQPELLAEYADSGVPMTYLRQLLLYNDGEHRDEAEIFEAAACDTNATGVRYYPVEPYGPHDYTASFVWQCDIME